MRYIALFAALLLTACDSETASFPGIEPIRVTVDSRDFDVYSDGREAQSIRMSFDTDLSHQRAMVRALLAIEQATGCAALPETAGGDQVITTVDIDC